MKWGVMNNFIIFVSVYLEVHYVCQTFVWGGGGGHTLKMRTTAITECVTQNEKYGTKICEYPKYRDVKP